MSEYWCVVAIDYPYGNGDQEAWIMAQSQLCRDNDILINGPAASDNGIDWGDLEPGLYHLTLNPRITGEDDFEVDVVKVEKKADFPALSNVT